MCISLSFMNLRLVYLAESFTLSIFSISVWGSLQLTYWYGRKRVLKQLNTVSSPVHYYCYHNTVGKSGLEGSQQKPVASVWNERLRHPFIHAEYNTDDLWKKPGAARTRSTGRPQQPAATTVSRSAALQLQARRAPGSTSAKFARVFYEKW